MFDEVTLAHASNAITRRQLMEDFVTRAGWEGADIRPLAGDASFRRYERVFLDGKQAVLMDAPPEKEDILPFIKVGKYLCSLGFSAPQILAEDLENGFLLLEDLGDDSYTRLLSANSEKEEELYAAAIDVLVKLHQQKAALDVPAYDIPTLMREISLFSEWYLPAVMGESEEMQARAAEFKALWAEILEQNPLTMYVPVLRDYHADNLLWRPEREAHQRVGLLDFQDALMGHAAYDLVSLLEDARRDVKPETVNAMLTHYIKAAGAEEQAFMRDYALLGAQRNTKIIGIFVRLGVRDGKTHYTKYLPRVWGHFMHDLQHPALSALKNWVEANIPQDWRGEISL